MPLLPAPCPAWPMSKKMAGPRNALLDLARKWKSQIGCCLLQDSYPRFLKSDIYKGLLEDAVIPLETKRR